MRQRMALPFILDNLAEAVHHAVVSLGAGASLQLTITQSASSDCNWAIDQAGIHSGLDNVQWVPEIGSVSQSAEHIVGRVPETHITKIYIAEAQSAFCTVSRGRYEGGIPPRHQQWRLKENVSIHN